MAFPALLPWLFPAVYLGELLITPRTVTTIIATKIKPLLNKIVYNISDFAHCKRAIP